MRYLPLTDADRQALLARIGCSSIGELFSCVPSSILEDLSCEGPAGKGEIEVERHLRCAADQNIGAGDLPAFMGAGAYRHHIPASVDHLIQRSEFLTSYTPYQPEIAQGTLQVLFEFQTQVAHLTGMEVANASLYDGSTATAEAVLMAGRITGRRKVLLSGGLHPHYRQVVETMGRLTERSLVETLPPCVTGEEEAALLARIDPETSCVVVQTPSFYGHLSTLPALSQKCQSCGALLIVVVTEILSLALLEPPGSQGADIVVGEGQSLGNPLMFGGPYLGLLATRQKYLRQIPGRLCGQTVDAEGQRGFVLTLSTREQHIRRDKATSNICTNAGLCCLAFSIHLTLLGAKGLTQLADINHAHAVDLAMRLEVIQGVERLNTEFFNEFTVRLPCSAAEVVDRMFEKGIFAGVPVSRLEPDRRELDTLLLVAVTELNTKEERAFYAAALSDVLEEVRGRF